MTAAASDAIPAFIAAMEAAGVRPVDPIAQRLGGGELIRFRAEGDKAGRQNAWAVLHLDGVPAGAFGSYKLGVSERWRADRAERLSPAERRASREQWAQQRQERKAALERGWVETAERARRIIAEAGAADLRHPYLARKGISGEGMYQREVTLLVPMADAERVIWNVQRIDPAGVKRFLKGGRTAGLMWRVGDPDAVICVGEGVGTMAAVRRATGHAVVAAFSGANLEPVARVIAAAHPDCDVVICADDDAHLVEHPTIKRNLGLDYAHAAAAAVGGRVAVPARSANNG
jgi:putative DNA primase/helicase